MSNVNEIIYVTSRQEITAKVKNLRNLAENAAKKGEHRDVREAGEAAIPLLDELDRQLKVIDEQLTKIVYPNQPKGSK